MFDSKKLLIIILSGIAAVAVLVAVVLSVVKGDDNKVPGTSAVSTSEKALSTDKDSSGDSPDKGEPTDNETSQSPELGGSDVSGDGFIEIGPSSSQTNNNQTSSNQPESTPSQTSGQTPDSTNDTPSTSAAESTTGNEPTQTTGPESSGGDDWSDDIL